MVPDKIIALLAFRDGDRATSNEIEWLQHWGLIDADKKLTAKGTRALAQHEDDERGLE